MTRMQPHIWWQAREHMHDDHVQRLNRDAVRAAEARAPLIEHHRRVLAFEDARRRDIGAAQMIVWLLIAGLGSVLSIIFAMAGG